MLRRIAALRAFDIDTRLGEIDNPVLLVATKDDLLVPYTRSLRLAEGLPQSELCLLDFGAHAVNITETDLFNTRLLRFLLPATRPF
ncbi:putative aminoacrylate hydrolase RutD [compost metagenome]